MLLYNKEKRSKSSLKMNGVEGVYVPRDARIEEMRGFRSAHFELGDRNSSKLIVFQAFIAFATMNLFKEED